MHVFHWYSFSIVWCKALRVLWNVQRLVLVHWVFLNLSSQVVDSSFASEILMGTSWWWRVVRSHCFVVLHFSCATAKDRFVDGSFLGDDFYNMSILELSLSIPLLVSILFLIGGLAFKNWKVSLLTRNNNPWIPLSFINDWVWFEVPTRLIIITLIALNYDILVVISTIVGIWIYVRTVILLVIWLLKHALASVHEVAAA